MKHIKYIFTALSLLACIPVSFAQTSPIHLSKKVSGNYQDGYTITLESFVQGHAESQTVYTPADVILVMDMSGSMSQAVSWPDTWPTLKQEFQYVYSPNQGWSYNNFYDYLLGKYRYLYNGKYYIVHRSIEGENQNIYTIWINLNEGTIQTTEDRLYLTGTGTSATYNSNIHANNTVIFTGTLYYGLSYNDLAPEVLQGEFDQPTARYKYWYVYGGQYYQVHRARFKANGDIGTSSSYPYYGAYVDLPEGRRYLTPEGLSESVYTVSTTSYATLWMTADVIVRDIDYAETRVNGLQNAVNSFIAAMADKSATENVPYRISLVTFGTGNWGGGGLPHEGSSFIASYPHLKEYAPAAQRSYVLKDFVDLSAQGSPSQSLIDAMNSLKNGSGGSRYDFGLSMANGLFEREGGELTGYDFDGSGSINTFERPRISGEDHTNYASRPKVVIIIGDGEISGNEITNAEVFANKLKNNQKASIFFVYVNDDASGMAAANRLASSEDKVYPVQEYDNELVLKLTSLTEHIGGAEASLGPSTIVQDVVTSDFKVKLDGNSPLITVKTAPYTDETGGYTASSFGESVESDLEPSLSTDPNTGETTITVEGFDFAQNWCGTDLDLPEGSRARGNKLIIEIKIAPDEDLIGGKLATNTADSGITYIDEDGVTHFEQFDPCYVNDMPLHLKIRKNGLVGDEGAIFTVTAVDSEGNLILDAYDVPLRPVKVILHNEDGQNYAETEITGLSAGTETVDYYYIISEGPWAWDYTNSPASISTKTQHKNPFVFTGVKQNSTVKNDESHATHSGNFTPDQQ